MLGEQVVVYSGSDSSPKSRSAHCRLRFQWHNPGDEGPGLGKLAVSLRPEEQLGEGSLLAARSSGGRGGGISCKETKSGRLERGSCQE